MSFVATSFVDKGTKVNWVRYKTFNDFIEKMKTPVKGVSLEHLSSRKEGKERLQFTGCHKFDDAIKLVEKGWPEGLKRFQKITESMEVNLGRLQTDFTLEWDVAGDMVDVGAFVEGVPEHMIRFPQDEKVGRGKVVEIAVDLAANWTISTDTFFRRGAVICGLIDHFILQGYGVEVLGFFAVSYFGGIGAVGFPIRRAGELVDMDRLAYCLAHASMYRRLCFSAMEEHLGINKGTDSGYGSPYHNLKLDSDIVFSGSWYDHCRTDEAAKVYMKKCVDDFNQKNKVTR